ncbi:hypothetical protein Scep_030962 [Stephania cephalantha]|uniref:Uncharacterized protein n=1 Tax=Stephania cephalantha TaxID=152367 RepID=A0AAP0E0T1_9MAGN
MGKYIPPTVRNLKRTDSQTIRQRTRESVMHGLLDSIGSGVVTTARTHYRRHMRRPWLWSGEFGFGHLIILSQ